LPFLLAENWAVDWSFSQLRRSGVPTHNHFEASCTYPNSSRAHGADWLENRFSTINGERRCVIWRRDGCGPID
jgi:hypothetical protein